MFTFCRENLTNETKSKTPGYGLAASFRVIIGDQDQVGEIFNSCDWLTNNMTNVYSESLEI